jgi:hypothetical protein
MTMLEELSFFLVRKSSNLERVRAFVSQAKYSKDMLKLGGRC